MRIMLMLLCCCAFASGASKTTLVWSADAKDVPAPQYMQANGEFGSLQRQAVLKVVFTGSEYSHLQINWCNWRDDHVNAIQPRAKTTVILRCRLLPGSRPEDFSFVCFGSGEQAAKRRNVTLSKYGRLSDKRWSDIQIPLADMSRTGELAPLGTPISTMIISTYGNIPGGLLVHSLRFKQ